MDDYPVAVKESKPIQHIEQPYRWIDDDCVVKECRDGIISVDDGLYVTAYRCPVCKRWPNSIVPLVYDGAVEKYTPQEMAERREERKKRYFETKTPKKIPGMEKIGI